MPRSFFKNLRVDSSQYFAVAAKTVSELVATLKANPGSLNLALGGGGTPALVADGLFQQGTKTDAVHVPYKSANEAISDLQDRSFSPTGPA